MRSMRFSRLSSILSLLSFFLIVIPAIAESASDMIVPKQDNFRKAIPRQGTHTYIVQFLYIVPSDKAPRPDYINIISEIIQHTQDFYGNHLGKTFLINNNQPIIVINSPYTEDHIKNGEVVNYNSTEHLPKKDLTFAQ